MPKKLNMRWCKTAFKRNPVSWTLFLFGALIITGVILYFGFWLSVCFYNKSKVPTQPNPWIITPRTNFNSWKSKCLPRTGNKGLNDFFDYRYGEFLYQYQYSWHPPANLTPWLKDRIVDIRIDVGAVDHNTERPHFPHLKEIRTNSLQPGDFRELQNLLLSGGHPLKTIIIKGLHVDKNNLITLGETYPNLRHLDFTLQGPIKENTWQLFPQLSELHIRKALPASQLKPVLTNCRSLRLLNYIDITDDLVEHLKQCPPHERIQSIKLAKKSRGPSDDEIRWLKHRLPNLIRIHISELDSYHLSIDSKNKIKVKAPKSVHYLDQINK